MAENTTTRVVEVQVDNAEAIKLIADYNAKIEESTAKEKALREAIKKKGEATAADREELVTYIVLDAGMAVGDNQIQILMVYDKDSAQLSNCRPSDLSAELNGVAFKSQFGEFSFASVPCEEMVSREELYLDLLSIVLDSADVERLILVSFNEEYGDKVMERLKGVKNKETIQFRMNEPEESIEGYQWEMLAYPVMQALGIRGEEL